MKTAQSEFVILRKGMRISWRVLAVIIISTILLLAGTSGCQPAPSLDEVIAPKAAESLGNMTLAAANAWKQEINQIDAELKDVLDRLASVEQVGDPALKWVQMMKERAVRENWTTRILEVMGDLSKLKNDRYQVVKLQFFSEMLSAGIGYSRIILIADLATGQTTEYDDLVNSLKKKIADLTYQREALVKTRTVARSTMLSSLKQAQGWKVSKVNATTYTVQGQGLGLEQQGLTVGQWTYSSDSEKMVPNDQAAIALQKVLTGK